jgi:hypothetical protein
MNEFPKAWKTKEKVYRPSRVVTKKKYERRDGCHACMARANSPALPRVTKGRVCLMTHSPFFFRFVHIGPRVRSLAYVVFWAEVDSF